MSNLLAVLLLGSVLRTFAAEAAGDFARYMNLGKAELENRNSAKAIEAFSAALKLESNSPPALRNLARADMLAERLDDARKLLDQARALEKESPATSYLSGLVHVRQSRFEQARPVFEEAVRLDPQTAALRFQLANVYQMLKAGDQALVQFRETVRLDPLHAAAHFKLAMIARDAGDMEEFRRQQEEFQAIRKRFGDDVRTPTALERCQYTRPEPAPGEPERPLPALAVKFAERSASVFPDSETRVATTAAVLEVDDTGKPALIVTETNAGMHRLVMTEGKFVRTRLTTALPAGETFQRCVPGNFKDEVPKGQKYDPTEHAMMDMLLLGATGVQLLQRTAADAATNVTVAAGLSGVTARAALWVDYDHDGDLDLLLAANDRLQLWQNNGDGRFEEVSRAVGLDNITGAHDLAAVDLNGNGATDLIVARGAEPTLVFMNQRTGRFARTPEPPGPWPPASRVLADDLNNDGHPDVLLLAEDHALVVLGNAAKRQRLETGALKPTAVALLDYDNDGWLDVCMAGYRRDATERGAIQLWRNSGHGSWSNVTDAVGLGVLDSPPIRDLVAADFDADGDTDLLALTETGQLHFWQNDGGQVNGQLKLRLVGTKTNPGGIGTRVELRAGRFWVVRQISGLPVEIGLAGHTRLDSVKTIWSNGIEDNQVDIAPKPGLLTIPEKNVAAGSCPYLYARDGTRFRFVTDLLGNSPLGLSLKRDVVLPADPDEIVLIGGTNVFQPHRGFFELEVTEELREVLYLDQAKLIAVDHPPEVEVHPTDKLGPPPFAPSEVWALGHVVSPKFALGDDGVDRTEAVRALDGNFAPPGPPQPPPLRGFCRPLALTLDFGRLDASRPLVLALTGWLQYGDASANIAASQNAALPVIPPQLEAQQANGSWQPLDVAVGLPAGKTKTVLWDLAGRLPPDTQRLRLTTTFEVRWDRIALGERLPDSVARKRELAPAFAELRWRGFSEIRPRASGHPQTPDYDAVTDRPPWRTTPQGWCTRYGDVRKLAAERDDQLVLLNAGDALRLRFKASKLPATPPGQVRTFFFYSVGWDKDADYNVVDGDRVEPLPVGADGNWVRRYNTRWVPEHRFVER